MDSKKLRIDGQEVNTRKVILLSSSSSSSSSSASSATIISAVSASTTTTTTIVQPDYAEEEEEGEYIEPKDSGSSVLMGNKRKYSISSSTSNTSSSSGSSGSVRVVSDNRGGPQVTVSEYNKNRDRKRDRERHREQNRDRERECDREPREQRESREQPHSRVRTPRLPRNSDIKIISLFSAMASNDPKIKLSAVKSLPPVSLFPAEILKLLQSEMSKTFAPIELRLAALDFVNEMVLMEQVKRAAIPEVTVVLLKLAFEDEEERIKAQALMTLGTLLETKSIDWLRVRNLVKFAVPKGTKTDDPFDLFSVLPREFNAVEAIFAVLSHVAANDIHRAVRLAAMELISKLPGHLIGSSLLCQSTKKDLQKDGTSKKKKQSNKFKDVKDLNTPLPLPLLCCGVFAHGIEDQFVKIRFAALNSLFALLQSFKDDPIVTKTVLCVFLDALLDECDLIRLASLKFIGQLGDLDLTVQSGLESLLAVLDDQNAEIRSEALKIIGDNLVLSETGDANSSRSATISETVLRTQRCVEAAILKYPEMEFSCVVAMLGLMSRVRETVQKSCNELVGHLKQCPIPKYMLPLSSLPTFTSGLLTNVHLIMQIPFMDDEKMKQARLVKIVSRMSVDDGTKLAFLQSMKSVATCVKISSMLPSSSLSPLLSSSSKSLSSRFNLLVTRYGHLESKYEAEKYDKRACFFLNSAKPPKPVAFFRPNSVKIDETRGRVVVEEYKLMGAVEEVKIALVTVEAIVPFEFRYGKMFVAPISGDCAAFKIINLTNNEIMYKTK